MTPTRRTPPDAWGAARAVAAVLLAALLPLNAIADDYDAVRAEVAAAYEAVDYGAMLDAAERAVALRPDHPGALFNLAFAQVLSGEPDASLDTLYTLLERKIDFGVDSIDGFAPLKALSGWDDFATSTEALREPVGTARVVGTYPVGKFVPEGIAVSDEKDLYLGSIHYGAIERIGVNQRRIASARQAGHWAVFGMRLVGDTLWYVSSGIDEFRQLRADDAGKTGLFAVNVDTRERVVRSLLPPNDNDQVLGDLVVANARTIYVADQADGMIYRYDIEGQVFEPLIERGVLRSPQGLVIDTSLQYLYVADYSRGLFRVSLATGDVERVNSIADTSLYGIDGLYRYGRSLIAIQNGISPHRVVSLVLSQDGLSIVSSRILAMNLPQFDEPTLGQVVGNKFVFIANSHWNRFDADHKLPSGLAGPVVLEVDLTD